MSTKMVTNSQLSTTESKKLSKQEQEKNHRHGDHFDSYHLGGERKG